MHHLSGDTIARVLETLPTVAHTYTCGDELEVTLVFKNTGERVTRSAALEFWAELDDPRFPWDRYWLLGITRDRIVKEFPHHVVELNSPVFRGPHERREWLYAALDCLRTGGSKLGLVPIGTDLHPHSREKHFTRKLIPRKPKYLRGIWDRELRRNNGRIKRLFAMLFPPAQSLLVNPFATSGPVTGRHGHHGGYHSEEEAFWVLNQFMALVPMFVAGTANGPLCVPESASGLEVANSGFATLRPGWFRALRNTGIGPIFRSKEQFQKWMLEQHGLGNLDDRLKLYFWVLRRIEHEVAPDQERTKPLSTNEYRMQGLQSSPEDILAWAAAEDTADLLLRCLYRLGTPLSPYMEQGPDEEHVERINADIAAAARYGLDAQITNPFANDPADKVKASEAFRRFLEITAPIMDWWNLQEEQERLREIPDGNAGYQRQLRVFREKGPAGVLEYLINEMNN